MSEEELRNTSTPFQPASKMQKKLKILNTEAETKIIHLSQVITSPHRKEQRVSSILVGQAVFA
jgi:hypothetical protein